MDSFSTSTTIRHGFFSSISSHGASETSSPNTPMPGLSSRSTSDSSATTISALDLGFRVDSPCDLPSPGVEFYETRRALWLAPREGALRPRTPSSSRAKLEEMLSRPDAVTNDIVWEAGVKSVWKGLLNGGKLRRMLPLWIVVKVLKAGWIRDGTWPEGIGEPPRSPSPQASQLPHQTATTATDERITER